MGPRGPPIGGPPIGGGPLGGIIPGPILGGFIIPGGRIPGPGPPRRGGPPRGGGPPAPLSQSIPRPIPPGGPCNMNEWMNENFIQVSRWLLTFKIFSRLYETCNLFALSSVTVLELFAKVSVGQFPFRFWSGECELVFKFARLINKIIAHFFFVLSYKWLIKTRVLP